MKISVIIPIYKVEKYLRQCVDSVLGQTYRDIEVILVDDGSPDRCPEICDEYAKMDERVVVVHKENGGLSDARNTGVSKATGDYGMFLDSDDYWDNKQALEIIVSRINTTIPDVLSFAYYKRYEHNDKSIYFAPGEPSMPLSHTTREEQLRYMTEHGLLCASAWNKVIVMHILHEIPFEFGKLSEDIEWTAKLLCKAKSFDYVAEPFYCYLQRSGSITQSISTKSCDNLRDAVIGCCQIAPEADAEIRVYLCAYAAYQFSTFFAVQAMVESYQKNSIEKLESYRGILRYSSNRKVKIMYYGTQICGLKLWCRILRITKPIWNSRRDRI